MQKLPKTYKNRAIGRLTAISRFFIFFVFKRLQTNGLRDKTAAKLSQKTMLRDSNRYH